MWSSRPICSRTVATMSGWAWPRIALICPEVKSSSSRPSSVNTDVPSARSMINGLKSPRPRQRIRCRSGPVVSSAVAVTLRRSGAGRRAPSRPTVGAGADVFPPGFFDRADPGADTAFYDVPRLVTHIDDGAIAAVGALYAELGVDGEVLDL